MSESAELSSGFQLNGYELLYCGVYLLDCAFTSTANAGDHLLPLPCSINSLAKINKNDTLDGIIIYPGFKVEAYLDVQYVANGAVGSPYVIDNTDGSDIIIKMFKSTNNVGSIKVYYNNVEIYLNGISNATLPTTASAT